MMMIFTNTLRREWMLLILLVGLDGYIVLKQLKWLAVLFQKQTKPTPTPSSSMWLEKDLIPFHTLFSKGI